MYDIIKKLSEIPQRRDKMQPIVPAFSSVNICFAANGGYAPYLAVSMYSLLCNADKSRLYDIVVLCNDVPEESLERLGKIAAMFDCCSLRFVDMSDFHLTVRDRHSSYITAETNYRLAILGELFGNYDRVLYLDCDTIILGDVSELFDTDLCGKAVGGAEAMDIRIFMYTKKSFFIDDYPYNFGGYAEKFMGIHHLERYFNAGVTLFDLKKCREITSADAAVELLNRRKWVFNDQDVLNMLFNESVFMLDIKWNYTTNIEHAYDDIKMRHILSDCRRSEYGIIHYSSGRKPWNSETPLNSYYHKYEKELQEELL